MDNLEYVQQHVSDPQVQQEMLAAMEKYGDNHWWESDDPRVRAYYQTLEMDESGRGFISFRQLKSDLEVLLNRSVYNHEFASANAVAMRQEVERAWIYGVGVTSERERQEREQESVDLAQRLAGDKVMKIEPGE